VWAAYGQGVETKTAEQVYKNIVQLKGVPADQVGPAMQFISASLGVECAFCHVPDKMDADDKGPKRTAREMMAMTDAINKESFRGRRQVTCYSCHRGSANPVNMPPVLESDMPARPASAAPPAGGSTVTVDEIAAKYVAAVGGAEALRKVTSRVMQGKILAGGTESEIEVYTKAPNKRITVSHRGSGVSLTAFDGTAGWMGSTGQPARDMGAADSASASLDAEFALALRLKEIFPQLRRGRPEQVGGVDCEVVNGSGQGRPAARLYFDKSTGLLLRMVRYTETPEGRMPVQIDYADYRAADGVKIPYRWTLSRPNGRFTIQISDVKSNAPIEDSRFTRPEGPVK
jgi:hypothetical protein